MRVCLRAWREVADGVQAGAAAFEQRWRREEDCALARRLVIGSAAQQRWGEAEWLAARRVLTWMRLVRAGAVHRARSQNPAWRAARANWRERRYYHALPHARASQASITHEWWRGRSTAASSCSTPQRHQATHPATRHCRGRIALATMRARTVNMNPARRDQIRGGPGASTTCACEPVLWWRRCDSSLVAATRGSGMHGGSAVTDDV